MDTQLLWFVSRATGVVTLTLFSAVVVLGLLTAGRAAPVGLGRAGLLRLHRWLSLLALVFLVVHVGTAILDGYVDLDLLDVVVPFVGGWAPFWVGLGTLAVDLGAAIGVTSLLRTRLPHRVWRVVHLSAYALWPLAVLHGVFTPGGDSGAAWLLGAVAPSVLAVLAAAAWRWRADHHADTAARRRADSLHVARTSVGRPAVDRVPETVR